MATEGGPANRGNGLARGFERYEQTFPALTSHEIERMRHFGQVRAYKDGELLFETGKPSPGMFVVLSGHVAITQRDGLGHVTPVIDQGPGQFLAEIGALSGVPEGAFAGRRSVRACSSSRLPVDCCPGSRPEAVYGQAVRWRQDSLLPVRRELPGPGGPSASTSPLRSRWMIAASIERAAAGCRRGSTSR